MKPYTDFVFYITEYKGNMPERDFKKLVIRASYEVQNAIFGRDIIGYEEDVQMATCAITDILYKIEQMENKMNSSISDKTVKTENVGDYSRTFESFSSSDIEKEISSQKAKMQEELRKYLLMAGLLYRGV